jgi:hypothetical protein
MGKIRERRVGLDGKPAALAMAVLAWMLPKPHTGPAGAHRVSRQRVLEDLHQIRLSSPTPSPVTQTTPSTKTVDNRGNAMRTTARAATR